MQNQLPSNTVEELAIAGERAGFSSQSMIFMLNAGISVATLIQLIQWGLKNSEPTERSSRWVM